MCVWVWVCVCGVWGCVCVCVCERLQRLRNARKAV